MGPPEDFVLGKESFSMAAVAAAQHSLPESADKFLSGNIAPAQFQVAFVADFVPDYGLAVFFHINAGIFRGSVKIGALQGTMGNPWPAVVIKITAIVDGTKMLIGVFFLNQLSVTFPVRNGFCSDKVVFVCQ